MKKIVKHKERIFGLDLLRAFAILFVVLGHGKFILNNSFLEGFPFVSLVDGVDLFFVLSGFLIGGILLKEINKSGGFKIPQLMTFWKRRWFRTLPAYYLILLCNYLFVKFEIINGNLNSFNYKFFIFTHNFSSPFYDFFWESWSLSIEEWFYIITPVFIYLFSKLFSSKTTFLLALLIMILLPTFYRNNLSVEKLTDFTWDVNYRKIVLTRLDSIGYGLLAAWLYYYFKNYWEKYKIPSFVFGISLMIFTIHFKQDVDTFYNKVLFFSLVPISVMLLLPLANNFKKSKSIFAKAVTHISKISYSMYLINLALVASVIKKNVILDSGIKAVGFYILYWIIVICMSSILFKYFENPMMKLRDKKFLTIKKAE